MYQNAPSHPEGGTLRHEARQDAYGWNGILYEWLRTVSPTGWLSQLYDAQFRLNWLLFRLIGNQPFLARFCESRHVDHSSTWRSENVLRGAYSRIGGTYQDHGYSRRVTSRDQPSLGRRGTKCSHEERKHQLFLIARELRQNSWSSLRNRAAHLHGQEVHVRSLATSSRRAALALRNARSHWQEDHSHDLRW